MIVYTAIMVLDHHFDLFVDHEQLDNLDKAEQFGPVIRTKIGNDPRFREISVGVYTGYRGCIGIGGSVDTRENFIALMATVSETNPPLPVHYAVRTWDTTKLNKQVRSADAAKW